MSDRLGATLAAIVLHDKAEQAAPALGRHGAQLAYLTIIPASHISTPTSVCPSWRLLSGSVSRASSYSRPIGRCGCWLQGSLQDWVRVWRPSARSSTSTATAICW